VTAVSQICFRQSMSSSCSGKPLSIPTASLDKTCRAAGINADKVRTGDQPQDRKAHGLGWMSAFGP